MKKKILLPLAVFIAGLCSIIYELLISTTATYFLGDGVRQFSIIIGIYLFSMGIGAFLSKYLKNQSLQFFILIEYALGFIGGISVPLLYFLFVNVNTTVLQILILCIIFIIGLLTGMEVPLLTFASSTKNFKSNLSHVLSLDYIGGLIATLLFPFVLLPFVGLFYSSILFGIVNILLGLFLNITFFKKKIATTLIGIFALLLLLTLVLFGGQLLKIWDQKIYKHPIVLNVQTPYQKIVLTKKQEDVRLYLNRVIQFSSADEHRYHESLVHIPLAAHSRPEKVLILGGGENLASREVLKNPLVSQIDVVDIDSTMFYLAKTNPHLTQINQHAATHPKVNLITEDAFTFLFTNQEPYDIIIADLPDPVNEAIARLYSKQFFLMAKRNLKKDGVFVTQSGEIYFSNTVFSCINRTLNTVFPFVKTYHTYIPSFGDWGFHIAANNDIDPDQLTITDNLQFLDTKQAVSSFQMPKDISIAATKINTLDNPIILDYFLDDWNTWKSDFTTNTK
ncbi:polyamine aminopropyltransferase [Aquimarina sp. TRL1]|uniref:polyamine aminopropyltransferase n=1 Tax=Aquimarina sp. (strain TRL1) TaxID=2736252 RepID=UPI00158BB730|nr:polyamine aminopropyltransferase [Aquimarina sp. TRL1]QKX04768.1 polyamine aminopropyltransferase [Aquimarina sp. TRL1]